MDGWLDCLAGASGDMLLGALVDAGAPVEVLHKAIDAVIPGSIELRVSTVERHGLGATKVDVHDPAGPAGGHHHRTWTHIRGLLGSADLPDPVRTTALGAFERLAHAEAAVHRTTPEQVHFHEVGALDAIADIVGTAAGLHALGVRRLSASTVSLGSGMTRGEHGRIPIPAPATLIVLRDAGAPVCAGPAPFEMCTPTGAALLATTVEHWGPLPELVVDTVGMGAGSRSLAEVANLLRLVLGHSPVGATDEVVLEANVDDLDPRLWPGVLEALLAAGAADAWLSPVTMKKGRPAHTVHVLAAPTVVPALRDVLFAHTTTIGLRQHPVRKLALPRETDAVEVAGQRIGVKLARHRGRVTNVSVEFDDVRAAARALDRPVRAVMAEATALAHQRFGTEPL